MVETEVKSFEVKLDNASKLLKKTVDATKYDQLQFTVDSEKITGDVEFDEPVESGNNVVIKAYIMVEDEGEDSTSTKKYIANVTVKNGNKLAEGKEFGVVAGEESLIDDLFGYTYAPVASKINLKKGTVTQTGSFLNEVAVSTGSVVKGESSVVIDDTFKLAGGVNTIYFGDEDEAVFGNDTVVSAGKDILLFGEGVELGYKRDGKDVVITATEGTPSVAGDTDDTSLGTVRVKDYLKKAGQDVSIGDDDLATILSTSLARDDMAMYDTSKKGNAKLAGTWLGEDIYGGAGNNKITTGAGNDAVFVSAGKDTITIDGDGAKTVSFDAAEQEIDDLTDDKVGYESTTTVSFKKGVSASLDIKPATGDVLYVKDGNNLVVGQNFTGTETADRIVEVNVKDYFKNSSVASAVTFDGKADLADAIGDGKLLQMGKGKITGTTYNDYLIGSAKADKITVNAVGEDTVWADAGNDTITFAMAGEGEEYGTKTLDFYRGDGKDTVVFASTKTHHASETYKDEETGTSYTYPAWDEYNFASPEVKINMANEADAKDVSYVKNGDDLVITSTYEKLSTEKKDVVDSITVKDFFNYENGADVQFSEYTEDEEETSVVYKSLADKLDGDYLTVNGVNVKYKDGSYSFKGTEFAGTDMNDRMTYTGKGNAMMIGGLGNDEYNLTLTTKSNALVYDWSDSDHNTVNFTNKAEDLRIFFNVDSEGNFVESMGEGDNLMSTDFLMTFEKGAVTYSNIKKMVNDNGSGFARFEQYMVNQEAEETTDTGIVPTERFAFYTTEAGESGSVLTAFDMNDYIDQIKSSVAGWFSSYEGEKQYANAMDVFGGGVQDDIKGLLAAYNVAYDADWNSTPEEPVV